MFKKTSKKLNIIEILLLFNLLMKSISHENISEREIASIAKKEGYDLTNPTNIFFNNICKHFAYGRKDITLEYRQKYFYLSRVKGQIPLFPKPIVNKTKDCFYQLFDFPYFFFNISFYFMIPIFFFQIIILILILYFKFDLAFYQTHTKKMEIQKQYGYLFFLCNKYRKKCKKSKNQAQNFNELTQDTENNVNQSENNTTLRQFIIKNVNNNSQDLKKITDSEQPNLKTDNNLIGDNVDLNNKELEISETTAGFVINDLKDLEDNENNKEGNNEENIDAIIGINLAKKGKEIDDYDNFSFQRELTKKKIIIIMTRKKERL